MTDQTSDNPPAPRSRRGPKPYPTVPLEEALEISQIIVDHGAANRMNRLRVFDRMNRAPNSGRSRSLVSTSSRYGLTIGSYQAEYLSLTDDGILIASGNTNAPEIRKRLFEISIAQFGIFNKIYEDLQGQRIPDPDVFEDLLKEAGVQDVDCSSAREVFTANSSFAGLVEKISGSESLVSIDYALESLSMSADSTNALPEPDAEVKAEELQSDDAGDQRQPSYPSVHIDIQIHIDSSARDDQIDQVFRSMARHLYGRIGE